VWVCKCYWRGDRRFQVWYSHEDACEEVGQERYLWESMMCGWCNSISVDVWFNIVDGGTLIYLVMWFVGKNNSKVVMSC